MILQQAHFQTALKAADQCLYCGATDELSGEHVIPFGLGGNLYVPRASCRQCAVITSQFERSVLKGSMARARLAGKLPSYRRSAQPSELTVTLFDGETPREVVLPAQRGTGRAAVANVRVSSFSCGPASNRRD